MPALPHRLAARTLELVDIPSESGSEAAVREHLLTLVPPALELVDEADEAFLFAPGSRSDDVPFVLLAGHYDTVPAQDNVPGRIEDGAVLGLGASDMKGGVAVAVELARDLAGRTTACELGLLLFGREELPFQHDPLPALLDASALAREISLAILLEPTDGVVHAGCLGNVIARLSFHGRSGHSARPWDADSAIAHAVRGLEALLAHEPREAVVAGLRFVEVLSVTRIESGIADNVIPDRATATLNFRYAPDRSPDDAESHLRSLVPPGAALEILSHAPAGQAFTDTPLVRALLAAGAGEVQPKQAWTNVADFTARGIEAVNFGPGHTRYAHRRDEQVEVSALVHAYETLRRFLETPIRDSSA